MATLLTVTDARAALTLRLAEHIHKARDPKVDLLAEIIAVTNEAGELFASYEAAVLAECERDVRIDELLAAIALVATQMKRAADGVDTSQLQEMLDLFMRRRQHLWARADGASASPSLR